MGRFAFFSGCLVAVAASVFAIARVIDAQDAAHIVVRDPLQQTMIVVAVEGAVAAPGAYALPAAARVGDALDAAGGVLPNADLSGLNRAAALEDGQRITVPAAVAERPRAAPAPSASPSAASPIDINRATAAELETLPKIGEKKAQAIVDYRNAHGPFRTIDELRLVDGITEKILEEIRPLIVAGQ